MAIVRRSLVGIPVALTWIVCQSSVAQAPDTGSRDLEEVIVSATASRIEGFESPTATTVLGVELLQDSAKPSVATTLNQLPSLGTAESPTSSGNGVGSGTQGANFLNLRSLGTNRTLVLLDSRRVVSSAATGQVDINMLPTTLLQRVEVVTGGASAAWGSDAVAGVVNLTLDTRFTGVKGSIQKGISGESDAGELRADLAGGMGFADGRGHVIASLNYTDVDSVDHADSRSWYRGTKVVNNPAFAPGNGEPRRITLDHTGTFLGSDNGHVIGGPLAGVLFNNDGSIGTFDFGTRSPPFAIGSTTLNDLGARTQLRAAYEQINGFLRGSYDVSQDLNVYVELLYGKTEAQSLSVPYYRFGNVIATRDNAFLPAAVAQRMDTAGVGGIPLALTNFQLGRATPYNDREIKRYVLGADYSITDNWKVSGYYEHGDSDVRNETRNNAITANYALAFDAVRDGAGNPVCRSTLTNPANGCVPLNVFGNGVASPAAIDYIIGTAVRDISLKQDVAALTFSGDVFSLPAGPIAAAVGGEYRREQLETTADAISGVNGFWVGNYKPAAGDYQVLEGFAEVVVPVFRDTAFGEALDLNGAVRFTDYSTSGLVTTSKIGLIYDVIEGVRLRGTVSRDIRAPNLNEYFSGGQSNSLFFDDPFVLDPVTGRPLNYLVVRTTSGNPQLKPEKADSFNIGVVYQPSILPGLRLAADYFDIEINGAIGTILDNQIPQRCFNGEQEFCALITRDPASGLMTNIRNAPVNFAREKLRAVDVEASYGFDLGGGKIDVRTFWTYTTDHYIEDAGAGTVDHLLGEVAEGRLNGGPTKWKAYSSVAYSTAGGFRMSLRHRYMGSGVIDADWVAGVDIDNNKVKSVDYLDLSVDKSFDIGAGSIGVFGSIENLFDAAPPRAPMPTGATLDSIGVSSAVHDAIGRYFRAGVRVQF